MSATGADTAGADTAPGPRPTAALDVPAAAPGGPPGRSDEPHPTEQGPAHPPRPTPPAPSGAGRRSRGRRLAGVALGALAGGAGTAAVLLWLGVGPASRHAPTAAAADPTSVGVAARSVTDGADPLQARCDVDATTVDSRPVVAAGRIPLGRIDLRYSPRCAAAWARFTPEPTLAHGPLPLVTVEVSRPRDGNLAAFRYRFDGRNVYSDLLLATTACVRSSAVVAVPGRPPASAATACRTGP